MLVLALVYDHTCFITCSEATHLSCVLSCLLFESLHPRESHDAFPASSLYLQSEQVSPRVNNPVMFARYVQTNCRSSHHKRGRTRIAGQRSLRSALAKALFAWSDDDAYAMEPDSSPDSGLLVRAFPVYFHANNIANLTSAGLSLGRCVSFHYYR